MAETLSTQDKADLSEIRNRLPKDDPRRAKIDTLIGAETSYTGNFKADFNPPQQRTTAKMPSVSQQEVHNKAEYLPAAGATVGSILGGGLMSIPGAALGGAAGEAGKQLINRFAGEGAPNTSKKAAMDIGKAGAEYGALEGGGFALGAGIGAGINAIKAARSPLESVAASRAITQSVNPVANEWPEYMKATQEQAGNIIKWAEDHGMKINTQRDWGKVAQKAADEANEAFKTHYVDPVAKQEVSITGPYRGATTDPYRARVSDVYKRIIDINRELRPAYKQTEQGIVQSKLANEGELLAEKASLTETLNRAIQQGTGANPESIAAARSRTAQLYTIADHTEAAVNARASSAGKAIEGAAAPTGKSGIVHNAIESLRGGREKIADRRLAKILKRTQTPTSEVPLPKGKPADIGGVARETARAGRAAERSSVLPYQSSITTTEDREIAELQQNLAQRIAKNNAAKAEANAKGVARATMRAGRTAEREAIPVAEGTTRTTEDKEIEELQKQLADRIAKNKAAKEAAQRGEQSASDLQANRMGARKLMTLTRNQ